MAYLTIKKVGNKHYAYLQESYREGGRVRTRTVEYLGAIEPAVAVQMKATRQQLGRTDMSALVNSVKAAAKQQLVEADAPIPISIGQAVATKTEPITTESSHQKEPGFFNWPADLGEFKVSTIALRRTQDRFAQRLTAIGVDPQAMPKVEVRFGHPDGMQRSRDGSFTIMTSRKTQNKRHKLNKTKLWQNTRRAMSLAYLDAIAEARPELHLALQSKLDPSHQSTKQFLIQSLAEAETPIAALSLSLQLYFWNSVPQKLIKKRGAEEFGLASFETLQDWRSEAAFVLAEAHKSGWSGMAERNNKQRRKLKSAITRHRNQLDGMWVLETVSARLSGKRRKIIRDIMAAEDKLRAVAELEYRQEVLRQHFPL